MAKPCPIRLSTRLVLVRAGANATIDPETDAVAVTGVTVTVEGDEIDRSNVYTATGQGLGPIMTGRRTRFEVTQELYPDFEQHRVLFGACAVTVGESDPDMIEVYPSGSLCDGSGIHPATVEIVEVGGNTWRAENVTGSFTIEASPGGVVTITWSLVGEFVAPSDTTYTTLSYPPSALPFIYRDSELQLDNDADGIHLATCPAFTFGTGVEEIVVPSACSPNGGGWVYQSPAGPAELALSGVLARKESVDKLWDLDAQGLRQNVNAGFQIAQTGDKQLVLLMDGATLQDPVATDVEGFAGYDVSIQGPEWSLLFAEVTP